MKKMIESAPPMRWHWKKTVLIMKLCLIFTLAFTIQLSASVYSQNTRFNLDMKNVSVEKVFNQIKKQSEFTFFYDEKGVRSLDKISVSVKNGTAEEILKKCLVGTGYTYEIIDKTIILKKVMIKEVKQQDGKIVKGKVIDEKGSPLPGVTIIIQGSTHGVSTDGRGRYSINVKSSDALRFSCIGYKTQIKMVEDRKEINVKMVSSVETLEEVTAVAFSVQKKESVTASIESIKPGQLKSSNSDLTASFAGNIAGIIGMQTGGLPGALTEEEMNTKFYIRGITSFQSNANIDPLILLDGVEASKLDLARIDPDDIESFSVMKDASATAMYGARGANGVILVKTKTGEAGKVYTSVRYETIFSQPTREIDVVDPITWMQKYNEASTGRFPGTAPKYTAEKIQRTASGKYPNYVYPANDWYKKLFKDYNINHHAAINVRGGSNIIKYYSSVTYNQDAGMLKTDNLNQFDCNIKNKSMGFRVNLNIELTNTAKLILNSFTTVDKYHGPRTDARQAYNLAFNANPVDFAPTYPADETYAWNHIRYGGPDYVRATNPYMEIQRGYSERNRFSTINKFEYIQSLDPIIKGLEFRGSVAFSKEGYFSNVYNTIPAIYSLNTYDHATGEHTLMALNAKIADRTIRLDENNSSRFAETKFDYQAKLMHTAAWGDHQTSFVGVFTAQETENSNPREFLVSLPNRNLGFAARLNYGYKDRYFIESSFGYNGSERFSTKNKMGFFPSLGLAWVTSRENFMRSTSSWLDYLKLRFSYGKVGNDGIINDPRFVYLQEIESQTASTYAANPSTGRRLFVKNYANELVTWEINEQLNFGSEFKLFNMFDINLDVYQMTRHNIFTERTTVPQSMGLYKAPAANIGKTRTNGFDLSAKMQKAFSPDCWFILNGTFTYSKSTFLEIEESENTPEWQSMVGKDISQTLGYIADGLFQSQNEIDNAPNQGGNVMPGDIRYRDVNNDGTIDIMDRVPIGFPTTPRIIYGLNGSFYNKGWEFSFAFQGSGDRSFFISPTEVSPFSDNKALLTAIANDHWSEDNMSKRPLWPRLSVNNLGTHNVHEVEDRSTYFMKNGRFLRCTSLSLTYSLDKKICKKFKLRNAKIFARANNPFIISDFKIWDVELGGNGFNYPIQKTYSLGFNLSF